MHFLSVYTPDIHGLLGRLMDRVRLADLPIARIEAVPLGEGYSVALQVATNDHRAVERIAHQMRQVIGTSLVEIGCACAPAPEATRFPPQAHSTAG